MIYKIMAPTLIILIIVGLCKIVDIVIANIKKWYGKRIKKIWNYETTIVLIYPTGRTQTHVIGLESNQPVTAESRAVKEMISEVMQRYESSAMIPVSFKEITTNE